MTETLAAYRRTVRARHRAAAIDRIADRLADGVLSDLPDLFLVLIERALDRDLPGVAELSHHHVVFPLKSPQEATWL